MENQKVKTSFNYVYFGSYCGNANFVWNDYDNQFQNSDSIDFTDTWKFECNSIPEIAREIFDKEGCVSDSEGIQIGTYEYTFDIYVHTERHTENKGFAKSFEYCLNYINSNPSQFEGQTIQICCNETEEVVFEK
jgi:hypothetical protein